MDQRDSEKIIRLAREGKQISKIWEEDFPNYDYWEIYVEVHAAGERSSLGIKRMITGRLNKLQTAKKMKFYADFFFMEDTRFNKNGFIASCNV